MNFIRLKQEFEQENRFQAIVIIKQAKQQLGILRNRVEILGNELENLENLETDSVQKDHLNIQVFKVASFTIHI